MPAERRHPYPTVNLPELQRELGVDLELSGKTANMQRGTCVRPVPVPEFLKVASESLLTVRSLGLGAA